MSDPLFWGHNPGAGCRGCPFLSFNANCRGTCAPRCNVARRDMDGTHDSAGAPPWCPLRNGPVRVVPAVLLNTEERLQRLEAAMYDLTQRERR